MSKVLQRVDHDEIGRSAGVEAFDFDAHQIGHLPNCNTDGRASDEGRDGGQGNEIDNPPTSDKANEADYGAANDCQGRGNDRTLNVWVFLLNLEDDITDNSGHDGDGTDGDIFRGGEEPVDEHAHEGRVETIFGRELSQLGVCHALGHHDSTDRDTRDEIPNQPLEIVSQNPVGERE